MELRGAEATEQEFRKSAGRHLYYHFATHGFEHHPRTTGSRQRGINQPVGDESAVHTGRLCGITLAGVNVLHHAAGRVVDDGILTALEVADMDFSATRLVVLSACETGLSSEPATGEGVLGMQRAFQVAGARTCVAALWKVGDRATHLLMDRFYRGLWLERKPPLEALCEAQRELLQKYRYDFAKGDLVERGGAGAGPLAGPPPKGEHAKPQPREETPARLSPKFWAPFVLSGDWR